MTAEQTIRYRAAAPNGQVFEFDSAREIHFAALVNHPPKGDDTGGWRMVKTSKSPIRENQIGQTARQTVYFRKFPHAVVRVERVS